MSDYEEQMRELRERFIERARTDRTALRAALAGGDHYAARFIAHKLAGAAGIFGLDQISVTASALERALPAADQLGESPDPAVTGAPAVSAAADALLTLLDQLD